MTDQTSELAMQPATAPGTAIEAFSFGDDVSVLDGRDLWGYFEGVTQTGDWYEPPVPMRGLAKAFRMSPHHQSAITFKVNQLRRHFVPSRWMDAETHAALVLDLLQMGNFYVEEIPNMAGRVLTMKRSPALHTRVGVQPGRFFFVKPGVWGSAIGLDGAHEFKTVVHHVFEPDVEQEVYGIPQWLSALQSGLLGESATLFRRRYYMNGAHAGFVFYLNEPTIGDDAAKAIKERLGQAKGVGNFKNLFIHAPGGKKDGVQIMPIAEVAAKDEFVGIKNMARDDLLAAHRVPPQLIGVIPTNNGGFGDVRSAMDVFFVNEIMPIMEQLLRLNDRIGVEVVKYRAYQPMFVGAAPAAR